MQVTRMVVLNTVLILGLSVANRAAADDPHDHGGPDNGLVEVVRNATRPFLDVNAAVAAGYGEFLGCVSGTDVGAMGIHYVNGDLVGDGQIDAQRPEALMYEMRNGRLVLLGVEYVVLADQWNANNANPPVLLGQVFTFNDAPNRFGLPPFYALHVWAWRDNPLGSFVNWNPRVSCGGFTGKP